MLMFYLVTILTAASIWHTLVLSVCEGNGFYLFRLFWYRFPLLARFFFFQTPTTPPEWTSRYKNKWFNRCLFTVCDDLLLLILISCDQIWEHEFLVFLHFLFLYRESVYKFSVEFLEFLKHAFDQGEICRVFEATIDSFQWWYIGTEFTEISIYRGQCLLHPEISQRVILFIQISVPCIDWFHSGRESRLKQPDILYGRTGQELPCLKICSMLDEVIAVDTGPDGGLTTVNRGKKKHLTSQDPSLSYIDSEEPVAPPREGKHRALFLDDYMMIFWHWKC